MLRAARHGCCERVWSEPIVRGLSLFIQAEQGSIVMQTILKWSSRHAVCSLLILAMAAASASAANEPFEIFGECETVEVEQEDDEAEGKEPFQWGHECSHLWSGPRHGTGLQDCDRISLNPVAEVRARATRGPPRVLRSKVSVCPELA